MCEVALHSSESTPPEVRFCQDHNRGAYERTRKLTLGCIGLFTKLAWMTQQISRSFLRRLCLELQHSNPNPEPLIPSLHTKVNCWSWVVGDRSLFIRKVYLFPKLIAISLGFFVLLTVILVDVAYSFASAYKRRAPIKMETLPLVWATHLP